MCSKHNHQDQSARSKKKLIIGNQERQRTSRETRGWEARRLRNHPGTHHSWRRLSETYLQRFYRADSPIRAFSRSNHAELLFSSADFPSSSEPLRTASPKPNSLYYTQTTLFRIVIEFRSLFYGIDSQNRRVAFAYCRIAFWPALFATSDWNRTAIRLCLCTSRFPLSLILPFFFRSSWFRLDWAYRESVSGTSLQCGTCRKTYFGNDTHFELTASSGAKTYGDPMPLATELFRYFLSLFYCPNKTDLEWPIRSVCHVILSVC